MNREQDVAITQHMARLTSFAVGMGRKQGAHGMWLERDHAECARLEKALKDWVTAQLNAAKGSGA